MMTIRYENEENTINTYQNVFINNPTSSNTNVFLSVCEVQARLLVGFWPKFVFAYFPLLYVPSSLCIINNYHIKTRGIVV